MIVSNYYVLVVLSKTFCTLLYYIGPNGIEIANISAIKVSTFKPNSQLWSHMMM